jgi:hypothetical protein
MNKIIHIFGGGTISPIAPHLALTAPAYGGTARRLHQMVLDHPTNKMDPHLHLTKMCGKDWSAETNSDVGNQLGAAIKDPLTKVIIMNTALCDYQPASTFRQTRFDTSQGNIKLDITPSQKLVKYIRSKELGGRKDIFAVGFKTTHFATRQEMFTKGLNLLKSSSLNLVLVNDTGNTENMIVTPEESTYADGASRLDALYQLIDMTIARSHLTFTQSTVISGEPIKWDSPLIPHSIKVVVSYCISQNAYKPFKDATVGHFAVKLSDTEFLTSIRKSDFNKINEIGMVKVVTDGHDTVLAYGAKPSVGGQSQRIVFKDHPGYDCIVHFHCPLKDQPKEVIPVVSQKFIECGSHECGRNTSNGLKQFGNLQCVHLDNHGPNILFNKDINPQEVLDFIDNNFDLSKKTGGYTV